MGLILVSVKKLVKQESITKKASTAFILHFSLNRVENCLQEASEC